MPRTCLSNSYATETNCSLIKPPADYLIQQSLVTLNISRFGRTFGTEANTITVLVTFQSFEWHGSYQLHLHFGLLISETDPFARVLLALTSHLLAEHKTSLHVILASALLHNMTSMNIMTKYEKV